MRTSCYLNFIGCDSNVRIIAKKPYYKNDFILCLGLCYNKEVKLEKDELNCVLYFMLTKKTIKLKIKNGYRVSFVKNQKMLRHCFP